MLVIDLQAVSCVWLEWLRPKHRQKHKCNRIGVQIFGMKWKYQTSSCNCCYHIAAVIKDRLLEQHLKLLLNYAPHILIVASKTWLKSISLHDIALTDCNVDQYHTYLRIRGQFSAEFWRRGFGVVLCMSHNNNHNNSICIVPCHLKVSTVLQDLTSDGCEFLVCGAEPKP